MEGGDWVDIVFIIREFFRGKKVNKEVERLEGLKRYSRSVQEVLEIESQIEYCKCLSWKAYQMVRFH